MEQLTELQKQKIQILIDANMSYFNALHLILQIPIERLATLDNNVSIDLEMPSDKEIESYMDFDSLVEQSDLKPRGIKSTFVPPKYDNSLESYNNTWETIYNESRNNFFKGR
jgi:hypothetical protein